MAFATKKWVTEKSPLGPPANPGKATPLDAAALEDLEARLSGYTDDATLAGLVAVIGRRLNALTWGVKCGASELSAPEESAKIKQFLEHCHEEGKTAYFPDGVYNCTGAAISLGYAVDVEFGPNVVMMSGGLWKFAAGTLGLGVELSANALTGSHAVKVKGGVAGYQAGEVILISTETVIQESPGGANRTEGQLVKIEAVNVGEETLVLREPLYRTFTTAEKAAVHKIARCETMKVLGRGKFTNPDELNTGFITIEYGQNVRVGLDGEGAMQPGVQVAHCYGGEVSGHAEGYKWNLSESKYGYGFTPSGSSTHFNFNVTAANGSYAFNCTPIDNRSGVPVDIRATGTCVASVAAGWGIHPGSYGVHLDNCNSYGCREAGVGTGAACTINGGVTDGTGVGTAGAGQSANENQHGVWANAGVNDGVKIKGHTFRRIGGTGVYFNVPNTNTIDGAEVSGCTFENIGNQCILASCPMSNLLIKGNHGYGWGARNVAGSREALRFVQKLTGAQIHDNNWHRPGAIGGWIPPTGGEGINTGSTYVGFNHAENTKVFYTGNHHSGLGAGVGSHVNNWKSDAGGVCFRDNVVDGLLLQGETTIASAAEITVDPSQGRLFTVNGLGANTTLAITSSFDATASAGVGHRFSLVVKQDGTGGRTITYPEACVAAGGGTLPQPSSAASSYSTIDFLYSQALGKWLVSGGSGIEVAITVEKARAEAAEALASRPKRLWMRTGAKAETFPRAGTRLNEALALLASERMSVFANDLDGGVKYEKLTFLAGNTAANAPVNQWACLIDPATLKIVAVSTDLTNTAWASEAEQTFPLTAPYTPAGVGLVALYMGLVVKATTVPTLKGVTMSAKDTFAAPAVAATSSVGLSVPKAVGETVAALVIPGTGGLPWAWVS